MTMQNATSDTSHQGSCHCKAVQFSFITPPGPTKVSICNCSICNMKGFLRNPVLANSRLRAPPCTEGQFHSHYPLGCRKDVHFWDGGCQTFLLRDLRRLSVLCPKVEPEWILGTMVRKLS